MSRLSGFYFAYFLALGAWSPYFSPWLDAHGLGGQQISLLLGVWYGTRIYAPALWVRGMAWRGSSAAWLVGGCSFTLLVFATLLLPLSFPLMVVAVALFATTWNAVLPQFEAITLHTLGAQRDRYALVRLWGSVGFLLANLLYGALLDVLGLKALVALMLPALALLVASAVWARPLATRMAAQAAPVPVDDDTRRATRRLLWIAVWMQVCHAPFYVYLSLFLTEAGWSATAIGGWWAVGVLAEAMVFTQMPRLLRRITPTTLLAVCLAAGGLRWTLLALWPQSAVVVGLTQALHAATFAMFHASLMQALVVRTPAAQLHAVQARLYAVGTGVGGLMGALLAGVCWTWVGHAATFAAAGVLSMCALALVRGLRHPPALSAA